MNETRRRTAPGTSRGDRAQRGGRRARCSWVLGVGAVVGVLAAGGLPGVLGAQVSTSAQNAQDDVSNAMVAAESSAHVQGSFVSGPSIARYLDTTEPELAVGIHPVAYGPAPHNTISVAVSGDGQMMILTAKSAPNGWCIYAEDNGPERPSTDPIAGSTTAAGQSYAVSATAQLNCNAAEPVSGLAWQATYPTVGPGPTPFQIEAQALVGSGVGLEIENGTYGDTASLVTWLMANDSAFSFHVGPVGHGSPVPASVVVSADGQIALFAVQAPTGRCVYAEDNEEAYPGTADGLAGATTILGQSFAPGPARARCGAADPPASLPWMRFPPVG